MSDFLSQFENGTVQPIGGQPAGGSAATPATSDPAATGPLTILPIASSSDRTGVPAGITPVEHEVEFDSSYRRRLLLRWAIIVVAAIAVVIAALLVWHISRLVEVPELEGKALSVAQTFSREQGSDLEVTEEYRMDADQGIVVEQGVAAGERITKGSLLSLVVSKGPDPSESLPLPDFSKMKLTAAEAWITENRADNLRLVQEYSDTVAAGDFLRLEFRGTDVNAENYCRRDYATLYYSKGAEVFEKDIAVPDFAGETRAEVESWAQKNDIELTVSEADSDTVEAGLVLSQSVAEGEKLAKHDAFAVTVSLGKASIVPNFANYTAETASDATDLPVTIKTRFDDNVAYGYLISQSLPSGTRLLPDDTRTITVVYSEGRPYLKDYRGTSEGELPAAFFNDYFVKGATVTYQLRYVDSAEPKGTVVSMSDYSRFIPTSFHVIIDISKGNLTPPPTP
jgi:serine/threonine-protein kinase